jgi:hypothetical protein
MVCMSKRGALRRECIEGTDLDELGFVEANP